MKLLIHFSCKQGTDAATVLFCFDRDLAIWLQFSPETILMN